jgi:hypothetical protein
LHVSQPSRKVLCRAKGKKGQQRNEGLYFEYRDVEEQPAVPGMAHQHNCCCLLLLGLHQLLLPQTTSFSTQT